MQQLVSSVAGLLLAGLTAGSAAAQALTTTAGSSLTVQNGALLYVMGDVQHVSGATLTNEGTVELTGDLSNAGTFSSAGLLKFSGLQDQTFTTVLAAVVNLTVDNAGAAGNNRLLLPTNVTVSRLLTLNRGLVRTQGSATLLLPRVARIVGETDGRYVQGRLQVSRAVNGSASAVDFTNGLVLNSNGQDLGSVTVTRTAGLQTAGVSFGQNVSGTTSGIDRVWQVTSTQAPAAPVAVTLSWVADDDNGFSFETPAQLWRADQAAGPWAAQGAAATTNARSFTAAVAQLGVFTVSSFSQPLPVTLVAFTAQRQGTDGLLRWTTATELNNAYFEVESSVDGRAFQPLGRVTGAGTSTQSRNYQLTDAHLARYAAAQVYYRLRQVDHDGTATYSEVRAVPLPPTAGFVVQAYPNPSSSGTEVNLALSTDQAGPAVLTVTDLAGRQLHQQTVTLSAGRHALSLDGAAGLATGAYLLHVRQGAQQHTLKLIRQ